MSTFRCSQCHTESIVLSGQQSGSQSTLVAPRCPSQTESCKLNCRTLICACAFVTIGNASIISSFCLAFTSLYSVFVFDFDTLCCLCVNYSQRSPTLVESSSSAHHTSLEQSYCRCACSLVASVVLLRYIHKMKERKRERERQVGTGEGGGKCIIAQWHTGGDVRDTVTVQRKKERERVESSGMDSLRASST